MVDQPKMSPREIAGYVDGFLDGDPESKKKLETALRDCPEGASLLSAYRTQTKALGQVHAEKLHDPVPNHLVKALEPRQAGTRRVHLRIAIASIVLTVFAGSAGWFFGQYSDSPEWNPRTFLQQAYSAAMRGEEGTRLSQWRTIPSTVGPGRVWQGANLGFKAPDLTEQGYRLVGTEFASEMPGQVLRLHYQSKIGSEFKLFVRLDWEESASTVKIDRKGDISAAFWVEGFLGSAIISKMPTAELRSIAETVRDKIRKQSVTSEIQRAANPPDTKNLGQNETLQATQVPLPASQLEPRPAQDEKVPPGRF